MKKFVDSNIGNPNLKQKAISIGYAEVYTLAKNEVIEAPDVETLTRQCKSKKATVVNPLSARDFYKSAALIETCREKEKTFEVPLTYLLRAVDKSKLIFQLRIFLKNCLKRKVPFFFSSRALNEFELKSPREVIAIGQILGLTYQQAATAISGEEE